MRVSMPVSSMKMRRAGSTPASSARHAARAPAPSSRSRSAARTVFSSPPGRAPPAPATAPRRLAGLGYRAVEAADGPEALRRLGDVPGVDLLLTDLAMPGGMTGLDLLRRARELRPGLPAVLTSGDAGPDGLRDLPEGTGWLPK